MNTRPNPVLASLHTVLDQLSSPEVLAENGGLLLQVALRQELMARSDEIFPFMSAAELEAMVTSMKLKLSNKLSPEDTQLVAKKLVASFLNIQAFYQANGFSRPSHAAAAMLGSFEMDC